MKNSKEPDPFIENAIDASFIKSRNSNATANDKEKLLSGGGKGGCEVGRDGLWGVQGWAVAHPWLFLPTPGFFVLPTSGNKLN